MKNSNVNSGFMRSISKSETCLFRNEGLNRIPKKEMEELNNHPMYKNIITRAALLLLDQLNINTVGECKAYFKMGADSSDKSENTLSEKENIANAVGSRRVSDQMHLSPLSKKEFQNLLKNGWPRKSQSPVSPLSKEEFKNLMKYGVTLNVSLNDSLESNFSDSPLHTSSPIIPERNSETKENETEGGKKQLKRALFRQPTPSSSKEFQPKEGLSPLLSPLGNVKMTKSFSQTPMKRYSKTRMAPYPVNGESPLENRASRLRRLKIEEQRQNKNGKNLCSDVRRNISIETLNSTLSNLSLEYKKSVG